MALEAAAEELDFDPTPSKSAGIEEEPPSPASSSSTNSGQQQQQRQCRICLDYGGDDLIAPCRCKGTHKFVHRSCLDKWRALKEGFAFSHCTECRSAFFMRINRANDHWWRKIKFQLLVCRDHTAIFVLVQVVVLLLGLLVYGVYGEELKEMFGYDEQHSYAFYSLAAFVLVLIGLLYGFFVAVVCGRTITNRHYHILDKQELTKEYIVEGLEEDEESQTLAPSRVVELQAF